MEKNENIVTNANKSGHEKRNVPTLRFKTFEQKWEYSTIGECSISLEYGMNAAAIKYDGKHKYIRITDIDEETNAFIPNPLSSPDGELEEKYLVKENDILFARTGASVGKSYLYNNNDGELYFAGFLIRARIKSDYNGTFIYYQTKSKKYDRWVRLTSMRSGQPGINSQEYSSYPIALTSKDEQDKIADFLQLLDNRISVQNKIIEDLKVLKKELCNKVFSKGSFVRLGVLIEEVTTRNKSNAYDNVLSVSNKMGFIKQSEQFEDRTVASENKSNYKVVTEGCFAYNPARINVGSIALLTTYKIGIISPMYVCFKTKKALDSEYLNFYYQSSYFYKELQKKLEGSVRQCLTYENMCEILIPYVSIEEQKEVAITLNRFMVLIATEEKYLKLLLKQKSYFLNAMFI